jgi:hypothetical protein
VSERNAFVGIDPNAIVVRAAVDQAIGHAGKPRRYFIRTLPEKL